jgi:hypothetical protein
MRKTFGAVGLGSFGLIFLLSAMWPAGAQNAKTAYPSMAPLEQYMMEGNAEIELARSAAPKSVAQNAEVLMLGRNGYETAVKGTNGFVCIVERAWTVGIDEPDFWNPKVRAPMCLNAASARSYLPLTMRKTELVMAGKSRAQIVEAIEAGLEKKELPALEPGAMSYMLSKHGYLNDRDGHWHPHVMFYVPLAEPLSLGANTEDSPIFAAKDVEDRLTVVFIPVAQWSDGTFDSAHME